MYWGRGAEALYGYRVDEIMGRDITLIVDSQNVDEERERMRQVLEEGRWSGTYRQRRKDGLPFWAHAVISLVKDDQGGPIGFIGIDRDVTYLKEAELALRQSEILHRTVLTNIRDAVFITDDEGRLTYVCANVHHLFGLEASKVETLGTISRLFDGPVLELLGRLEGDELYGAVWHLTGWDGKKRVLSIDIRRVEIGDGTFLWTCHDISELHEAREALEQRVQSRTAELVKKNAMLSALLSAARGVLGDHSFEVVAQRTFDICRSITGAQAGYVAMLAADGMHNDVIYLQPGGLPCTVDPSLPMPIRGLREVAYASQRPVYENDFAHSAHARFMPSGHAPLQNVMFAPLRMEGKVIGLMGLGNKEGGFTEEDAELAGAFSDLAAMAFLRIRDCQALASSEAALRRSEGQLRNLSARLLEIQEQERRRIAAELHDELGQSLMVIKLRIGALVNHHPGLLEGHSDEIQALFDAIVSIADSVRRISHELRPAALEVSGLVTALEGLVDQMIVSSDLKVEMSADSIQGMLSPPQETALYRVVQEAVSNILKHAQARHVDLSIQRTRDAVVIDVADDGQGFDAAKVLDGATKGLGLVTMQERVRMLDATLHIQSRPGDGTRVQVKIPLGGAPALRASARAGEGTR